MIRVQLTEDCLNTIKDWCDLVHEERKARDINNNDNHNQRINREITGKIGEAVVACLLKKVKKIDWKLYSKGKVQFSGDLGKYIHVKTCGLEAKGTNEDSWLVDWRDFLYHEPRPKDMIYLAYADVNGLCEVLGYVKAQDVFRLWKNALKLKHKRAIYLEDIEHLIKPIQKSEKDCSKYFEVIN